MSKIFKSIKQGVSAAVDFGEGNIKHVTAHKYAPCSSKSNSKKCAYDSNGVR